MQRLQHVVCAVRYSPLPGFLFLGSIVLQQAELTKHSLQLLSAALHLLL